MKKRKLFIIVAATMAIIFCCILIAVTKNESNYCDTVTYNGKTYELLEYNADILTYSYKSNEYLEIDEIHPAPNEKWDAVYFNGDIFIEESQVKKATGYYSDDNNYNWFAVIESDVGEIKNPLSVTQEELKYLYNMENMKRQKTIVFDDIKHFASIVKESKDGFIFALTTIVHCDNSWYWKTEVMTDDDREYVIPLPETICKKLFDVMK